MLPGDLPGRELSAKHIVQKTVGIESGTEVFKHGQI
jgi:hypothetical protein